MRRHHLRHPNGGCSKGIPPSRPSHCWCRPSSSISAWAPPALRAVRRHEQCSAGLHARTTRGHRGRVQHMHTHALPPTAGGRIWRHTSRHQHHTQVGTCQTKRQHDTCTSTLIKEHTVVPTHTYTCTSKHTCTRSPAANPLARRMAMSDRATTPHKVCGTARRVRHAAVAH